MNEKYAHIYFTIYILYIFEGVNKKIYFTIDYSVYNHVQNIRIQSVAKETNDRRDCGSLIEVSCSAWSNRWLSNLIEQ